MNGHWLPTAISTHLPHLPHLPYLPHLPHLPHLPYLPYLPYLPFPPHLLFRLVYIPHAQLLQPGPEAIEVEAQLAAAQPLPRLLLFGDTLGADAPDFGGGLPRHHHHTVHVTDDDVARMHDGAGADHG